MIVYGESDTLIEGELYQEDSELISYSGNWTSMPDFVYSQQEGASYTFKFEGDGFQF